MEASNYYHPFSCGLLYNFTIIIIFALVNAHTPTYTYPSHMPTQSGIDLWLCAWRGRCLVCPHLKGETLGQGLINRDANGLTLGPNQNKVSPILEPFKKLGSSFEINFESKPTNGFQFQLWILIYWFQFQVPNRITSQILSCG